MSGGNKLEIKHRVGSGGSILEPKVSLEVAAEAAAEAAAAVFFHVYICVGLIYNVNIKEGAAPRCVVCLHLIYSGHFYAFLFPV